MKKIILFFAVSFLISCNTQEKDFVALKGTLTNNNVKTIIVQGKKYSKNIEVNNDGMFSDTLKAPEGMYMMTIGDKKVSLYLKNGFDLDFKLLESSEPNPSALYSGNGSEINNFVEGKRAFFMSEYADPNSYFKLDKSDFENRVSKAKELLNKTNENSSKIDSSVLEMMTRSDKMLFTYIDDNYEKLHSGIVNLVKGKPSPTFSNYENFTGGTTSLEDLKGKFVYIDIWATWCGPCKAEIPNLKALENDFHGKNIEFVSISVDNIDGRRGSHESWLKMVEEKQLGGIQLFANNDFRSEFIQAYNINSIPRFILIDPNGNIVDSNALRPSNSEIRAYFKELGI